VRPHSKPGKITYQDTNYCKEQYKQPLVECLNRDFDINLNFLSDSDDYNLIQTGFKQARKLIKEMCISYDIYYYEILPNLLFSNKNNVSTTSINTYNNLYTYCWLFSQTYFHACGTCPMENNNNFICFGNNNILNEVKTHLHINAQKGVVNEYLSVIGCRRLRIADASIIPLYGIQNVPISLSVMAIALKASEFIQEGKY
jgi:hypothetical protein